MQETTLSGETQDGIRPHNFRRMIDSLGDPALMCTDCLACMCCEPFAAEAACKGEPEWIDDDDTVERP